MSAAARRIGKEISDLTAKPTKGFELIPNQSDIYKWEGNIDGPEGTPYKGHKLHINITLPAEYPHKPPVIVFNPPIYHPNVDPKTGIPCLSLLDEKTWPPKTFVRAVIESDKGLIPLLINPEPSHAVDPEIGRLFVEDRAKYNQNAIEWTRQHNK